MQNAIRQNQRTSLCPYETTQDEWKCNTIEDAEKMVKRIERD
jgi:hypothetical protein